MFWNTPKKAHLFLFKFISKKNYMKLELEQSRNSAISWTSAYFLHRNEFFDVFRIFFWFVGKWACRQMILLHTDIYIYISATIKICKRSKKGDLRSMPAPEEAFTTKHTGERHSTAEPTAPLRIVGELSHLKHSVEPP